jgi:hypothetical protein
MRWRLSPLHAAFLETRRYAAWLGATTEFTKMEGIAHSIAERKQWTVISYVRAGMIDGRNGTRPQDDIRLSGDEQDLTCGVVYESQLRGGQKDSRGAPIASDFVAIGTPAPPRTSATTLTRSRPNCGARSTSAAWSAISTVCRR